MKIQISIPDEVSERVDDFCKRNKLKRSVVYQLGAQQLINQREAIECFKKMNDILLMLSTDGKLDDEAKKSLEEIKVLTHYLSSSLGS